MVDMQKIAEGKEAVLDYLESEGLKRTGGRPGAYLLQRDDSGNLVAFIAGHSFIGSGVISLDGNRLMVVDGILVNVIQK
jgi:hypothetical protein